MHAALGAQGSVGTEFWLTFPANIPSGPGVELSVFISAGNATTGTVAIPGLGINTPFSVAAGAIINVPVTITAQLSEGIFADLEMIEAKGIHITADQPITVYGLSRQQFTTDAYLGLPVTALGLKYRIASYAYSGSELAVVATENSTTVTLVPTTTTAGHAAGVPYSLVLNQGQTYVLYNQGFTGGDLTGTLVTADKPIAVFGAHRCAMIPTGYFACDHIVEQMAPLSSWGKRFVTFPLATRLNGDIFRVIADSDNTVVTLDSVPQPTINAGKFLELTLTAASLIESDKPVMLVQYSAGTNFDSVVSDPFMMLVPPFEQFVSQYVVSTPVSGFANNFINLVVPAAEVGAVTLDGVPVPAGGFIPISTSGYWGVSCTVALGPHTISATAPIGVWVYGFDQADSYGYPGGAQTSSVALVDSLTLSPKNGAKQIGQQHCVTATALAGVSPVAGVRIDFVRTGVHPGSGFAFTDSGGQAVWCWSGSMLGIDNIVGRLGTLSDTAKVTWYPLASPTITPTSTITPTFTVTPTLTVSATLTVTSTLTATSTITSTITITQTFTITPTFTPTTPPLTLVLHPPNPNPSNNGVWLPYSIGTNADVDIQVWTIAGEPVRLLKPGFQLLGTHEEFWDHRNEANAKVGSGIYIYRVRARSPVNEERREFGKCAVLR